MEVEKKPERGPSVSEARAPVPLRTPTLCSPSILPPVCPGAHTPVHLRTSSSEIQPWATWRDSVGWAWRAAPMCRPRADHGPGRRLGGARQALECCQHCTPQLVRAPAQHRPRAAGARPPRTLLLPGGDGQAEPWRSGPGWSVSVHTFPLRPAQPSGLGAGWQAGSLVRPRPGTPLRMCSGPRAARGRWSRVPRVRSCSLGSPGLRPIANQFPGPRLPVLVKRNTPRLV